MCNTTELITSGGKRSAKCKGPTTILVEAKVKRKPELEGAEDRFKVTAQGGYCFVLCL